MPVMAVNNENQHQQAGDYRSRPRWSAGKKMEAVLRLLGGESLEELSRELQVEAHRLAAWRDDFLEGGKDALKGQRPDRSGDDRALRQAERKVGQLTMENEILRAAAEKRALLLHPWVGWARPGSGGHSPPTLSMASPMSASGDLKPKAIRVSKRMRVLTDSTRPLDRPCSKLARIPARWSVIDRASLTKAGMRQRRAHESQASSSATARAPLSLNTSRSSSLSR